MAINLQKGQRVSLDNTMKLALVGLGWQTNQYDGEPFDLDASAFLLGSNGKCLRDEDFIFYKNLRSRNDAVVHQGDEVKGGDGNSDDEQIIIDFTKIPPEVEKIAICVSIYDAENNHQNFGQVSSAYIRVAKLANEFDAVGEDQLKDVDIMTKKRMIRMALLMLVMTVFMTVFSVTAFADGGNVSQAIEGTWNTASGQIKDVVNNVVFPIIDVILAVFFFAKLGLAYFDYRKSGHFEWTGPAILFACLIFTLTAPTYIWTVAGV